MKNKISDIRDHLFAALERLGDEGMSAEQVASEVERAKAVSGLVGQYVALAKAETDAARLYWDSGMIPSTFDAPVVEKPALRAIQGGR